MKSKLTLAVAVLAGALSLQTRPAAADTLTVDDDRAECPHADHTSIQEAVLDQRAAPGATVVVCPGRYLGPVTVTTPGLVLEALDGELGAPGACFDENAPEPDPSRAAIVEGAPYSFNLAASDVHITGFVIQGTDYGIVTSPDFSGYEVSGNLVQNSMRAGINLRSSGSAETVVQHNCLRSNERGTESENPGTLRNARIAHNSTFQNGRVGLGATGTPGHRAEVTIEHNVSRADGLEFPAFSAAIMISSSENSRIEHNESGGSIRGVWVAGGNVGLAVVHNRVNDSQANGILINARASEPMIANLALDISDNHIRDSFASGLAVSFSSVADSLFSRNHLRDNGIDGIFFAGNRGNRLEGNHAVRNGADGIRSLRGASGNVFADNHMRDNAEHDAHDDNRQGNEWIGNRCISDLPSGSICAA